MACVMLMGFTMASAATFQVDGIFYQIINDGTAEVISPMEIDEGGASIGIIFDYGYVGDVVIPETVSYNGVEYTVTTIADGTFQGATRLTSISLPSTISYLGSSPFTNCPKLADISVNEENPFFASLDGVLYNKDFTKIIACPAKKTGGFILPSTVLEVDNSAFWGCGELTSIELPASTNVIGFDAFRRCEKLSAFVVPDGVTEIKAGTFYDCRSMKKVVLPSTVADIGYMAFFYCQSLDNISWPENLSTIDDNAFEECVSLTEVILPNSLTHLGADAFSHCTNLENVELPASLRTILSNPFGGCSSLNSLHVDPENAFYCTQDSMLYDAAMSLLITCPATKEGAVTLPPTLKTLGRLALSQCAMITDVSFPVGLETIEDYALQSCLSLKELHLPHTLKTVGQSAFFNCVGLERIIAFPIVAPNIHISSFPNVNTPLYVPGHYKTVYTKANYWKNFKKVYAIQQQFSASTDNCFPGKASMLHIFLLNAEVATKNFQCDIQLPAGVILRRDEEGNALYTLSDRYVGVAPTVSITEGEDNAWTLRCELPEGGTLFGNEGLVVDLPLTISAEMQPGEYEGNIMLSSIQCIHSSMDLPDTPISFVVENGLLGDVNGDEYVDVTDVMMMVSHILGDTPEGFRAQMADVNVDEIIDVTDIMLIVNMILNSE